MGRATRWFKGLFGIKSKQRDRLEHSGQKSTTKPLKLTPGEAALLRSFYSGSDNDHNRHAIAVATATSVATDTSVAAAQTITTVVCLTVQDHDNSKNVATTKIQRVFRGYLARRALRALKAFVKIQALVRGSLVRKQVAATLRGMQTLIRVQTSVLARANKSRRLNHKDLRFATQFQAPKCLERFHESSKIVEVDIGSRLQSRSRRTNSWISTPSCESFRKDFSYRILTRVSIPGTRDFQDQECHFPTSQSTPRLTNSCSCNSRAKNICVESYFGIYNENPNYMAKTKSFRANSRSFSALRETPKPCPDTKMSIHELMESRNSMRMQRSCSRAGEAVNFKNVVMGRFGRSIELVRES